MQKEHLVALITPFCEDGALDLVALERLIVWHIDAGTHGLVLCGTTGEGWALTEEEKFTVLCTAVRLAKGKLVIVFNAGTCATKESVELTRKAKDLGADRCLAIVPYYNKPTEEGCFRHFEAIAAMELPLIVYYHPGRTGVRLTAAALARIASLPGVLGIKDASGEPSFVQEVLKQCPTRIWSGDDLSAFESFGYGAQGTISVIGNIFPGIFESDAPRYLEFARALALEVNPQCVKYLASLHGLCRPVYRLPLIPPREETMKILKKLQVRITQPICNRR